MTATAGRLRALTEEYQQLAARLRQGGGAARVARMHEQGKLAPRERVEKLLDPGTPWLELGLLVAYDQYDGQAPGAGVITGIGVIQGREVVVVANDATVKAGSWWPGESSTPCSRPSPIGGPMGAGRSRSLVSPGPTPGASPSSHGSAIATWATSRSVPPCPSASRRSSTSLASSLAWLGRQVGGKVSP